MTTEEDEDDTWAAFTGSEITANERRDAIRAFLEWLTDSDDVDAILLVAGDLGERPYEQVCTTADIASLIEQFEDYETDRAVAASERHMYGEG